MDASEVIIIVLGFNKALALRNVVEGGISHLWTASILQMHQKGILAVSKFIL
jgi:glucosamine-6-phosphate deaminase